jgi:hypothetical protein
MNKLDINITKASLRRFSVEAEDENPIVNISLDLMTEGGKVITEYSVNNRAYYKDHFDLPIEAYPLIGQLALILEKTAVKQCRDQQMTLPENIGQPNLADIPF